MRNRQAMTHGHVALLGDVDDEELDDEPMAWTPQNDPDQLAYNRLPPDEDDEDGADEGDEPSDDDADADETEDDPPKKLTIFDAVNAIVQTVRDRFSQVRTMGLPDGLRRKNVVFALFVQSDGRVKVLR